MKKLLQHKFVDFMPRPLEDGIIYISIRFNIVSHNCCCGCGNEVVTNLSPNGWQLTYDGQSVSLYPSIGNWDFACRSHYWIKKNRVQLAESWSSKQIRENRELESHSEPASVARKKQQSHGEEKSFWIKIKDRFR